MKKRNHGCQHPGGKLRELGADQLSDTELLSILISSGIKGKSAEEIAGEALDRFGSFKGMANQPYNPIKRRGNRWLGLGHMGNLG